MGVRYYGSGRPVTFRPVRVDGRPLPLYLTAVLDLADRKVIGWALSNSLKAADTSVAAWRMALKNRNIEGELLFHRTGDPV